MRLVRQQHSCVPSLLVFTMELASDCLLVDEYDHILPHLVYSSTSVPGRGANLTELESQLLGCKCSDVDICLSSVSCSTTHICHQNYSSDKKLLDEKWLSGGVTECNSECSCSPTECLNRVVQYGPRKNLTVFISSSGKGYGLNTKDFIPKGAFICEYAGEVIGMNEAKIRFKAASVSGSMNYIFVLKETVDSAEKKTVIETVIDPSVIGNIGRYINHSCDPNSGIIPVRIDSPVPKLGIFAKRNILPKEEITYDYSGGCLISSQICNVVDFPKKPCYCGSQVCLGHLPFDVSLL